MLIGLDFGVVNQVLGTRFQWLELEFHKEILNQKTTKNKSEKTKSRTTNQKTQIKKPRRSSTNPNRTQERRRGLEEAAAAKLQVKQPTVWTEPKWGKQLHDSNWTQAMASALWTRTVGFMHFSESLIWSLKKEKWRKKKDSQYAEKWRKKKDSQSAEIVSLRL